MNPVSNIMTNTPSKNEYVLQKTQEDLNTQWKNQTKIFLSLLQNQTLDSDINMVEFGQMMIQHSMANQQIMSNQMLDLNNKMQAQSLAFQQSQHLGKTFVYETNLLPFNGNEQTITCIPPNAAQSPTIVITNNTGQIIKTLPLQESIGKQKIAWDGLDNDGNPCNIGDYYIFGQYIDKNNKTMEMPTYVHLTVDEISTNSKGEKVPVAGGLVIDLNSKKLLSEVLSPSWHKNNLSIESAEKME